MIDQNIDNQISTNITLLVPLQNWDDNELIQNIFFNSLFICTI